MAIQICDLWELFNLHPKACIGAALGRAKLGMMAEYCDFSTRQQLLRSPQWRDVERRRKAGRNNGIKINGFKQRRQNRGGAATDKQDLKRMAERLQGVGGFGWGDPKEMAA